MHFIGSAPLESLSLWEQRRRPPPAALPSQALTRQLSQRESPWQAGQVSSGRAKLICFVDCSALLSRPAALPSQALRASSPKGRALGRPVKFPLDEQSLFVSWTVVPCCLGQRPCPLRRFAPALPKGEPLAGRSSFLWTSKAYLFRGL